MQSEFLSFLKFGVFHLEISPVGSFPALCVGSLLGATNVEFSVRHASFGRTSSVWDSALEITICYRSVRKAGAVPHVGNCLMLTVQIFSEHSVRPVDELTTSSISSALQSFTSAQGLSVYYTNCRSLLPQLDELRALANANTPDLIALSETWLDDTISDSEVSIPTYRVFCRDRSRHGGVAIYVSEAVLCKLVLLHDCLELLSLVLKTDSGTQLVSLIYIQPSRSRPYSGAVRIGLS